MKLTNSIKIALASSLIAAPMAILAAPPAAFDAYTIDGAGTITSGTAGCSSLGVNEAGFAQEQCVISGKTYIHTILDDQAGFIDENWIEMGGAMGGISDKQTLVETSGTETFSATSKLNTGGFMPMGQMGIMTDNVMVSLQQGITDTGAQQFSAGFDFKHGMNMVGMDGYNGKFADLTLTSSAGDTTYTSGFKFENFSIEGATVGDLAKAAADQGTRIDQSGTLNDPGASIVQDFSISERSGRYTTEAGSAGTGTITWAAGDLIVNTLLGQEITGAGAFGLHDFANETQGTGTGVDSQTSSAAASFYTPAYTSGADPFAAF